MHHLQQSLLTAHGIQLHLHLHWQHGENRLNNVYDIEEHKPKKTKQKTTPQNATKGLGRTFFHCSRINTHIRKHTDGDSFCCYICGRSFRQCRLQIASQVYRSWNTCVKLVWSVPRATHTYFVDQLLSCGLTSLKTDMLSRYVKFVSSLQHSASAEVVANIVLRDVRSNTGANVRFLETETGLDLRSGVSRIKRILTTKLCLPEDYDSWRLQYLGKLLTERGELYYRSEDITHISELVDSLCIN